MSATALEPVVSQHQASAETASSFLDGIRIGTELMATDDIQLSKAGIARGSKVSVTKVLLKQGQVSSVDVALADGYVVKKVAIATLHNFFRIVSDRP
jgi:hypothetical protein